MELSCIGKNGQIIVSFVKLIFGKGFTIKVLVILCMHPLSLTTVSVAVCVPDVLNMVFVAFTLLMLNPLLKVQFLDRILSLCKKYLVVSLK